MGDTVTVMNWNRNAKALFTVRALGMDNWNRDFKPAGSPETLSTVVGFCMPKGVENIIGTTVITSHKKKWKRKEYQVALNTFVDLMPIIEDNDASSGFENEDGSAFS